MAKEIVPATVAELRDGLRGLLDDEDARANSLNARGSALTGFVGVVLSVAAATVVSVGSGGATELRHGVKVGVGVVVAVAFVALLLALVCLVVWVLLPRPGKTIGTDDTDQWGTWHYVSQETVKITGYLLNGYSKALRTERVKNGRKAKWLRRSYVLVLVGLGLIALAGAAATLDRYVW